MHHVNPLDSSFNSLPRRSSQNNLLHAHNYHHTGVGGGTFQRNTPVRRSTGIVENHMDYYVPRSMSEFNLSGVGDLALPPPKRTIFPHLMQQQQQQPQMQPITTNNTNMMPQSLMGKPREKMVTFEDESKCPHGVPTTPRKGGPMVGDVFM